MEDIGDVLDLDRYPLDRPASPRGRAPVAGTGSTTSLNPSCAVSNTASGTATRTLPAWRPSRRP